MHLVVDFFPAGFKEVRLFFLLLFLCAAPLSLACQKPAPRPEKPTPVEVAAAVSIDAPLTLTAFGTVSPVQKIALRSQVSGSLSAILFKEGQIVKAGQPLFRIDPRPFETARMKVEASLAQANILAQNARNEAQRAETLYQKNLITEENYEKLVATAQSLQAAVRIQEALLAAASLDVDYCTIRAPISGRTGALAAHQGDSIKANDTILVTINQIDPINVVFSAPEKNLDVVRSALAVGAVPVNATLDAGGESSLTGKLTFVDNTVDVQTGSIMLKAEFDNKEELLWPGRYIEVSVVLGAIRNAVAIPFRAVQTSQDGYIVFIVDAEKKAKIRRVSLGPRIKDDIIVNEGIKPGEQTVVDGQVRLRNGSDVLLRNTLDAAGETSR